MCDVTQPPTVDYRASSANATDKEFKFMGAKKAKNNKDYQNHLLSCEIWDFVIINSVLWLFDKRHFNRKHFNPTWVSANKPFCYFYFKSFHKISLQNQINNFPTPTERRKVNFTSQKPSTSEGCFTIRLGFRACIRNSWRISTHLWIVPLHMASTFFTVALTHKSGLGKML